MSGFMQSVATINSLIRTLLALVLVGVLGAAGWYGYRVYNAGEFEARERQRELVAVRRQLEQREQQLAEHRQQIEQLSAQVEEQAKEIQRLATSNRLLKMQHRVAQLQVLDQRVDEETGETVSEVEFIEVNEEGAPISKPMRFPIRGDVVYLDNWIVKFEDKYVEKADLERGTSIVLFRRIFGENQRPTDGFSLDQVGSAPTSYARGGQMSELEQQIWNDFWQIANNRQRAAELGIRAAHGEAVSVRLREGAKYRVELRASDGLSIVPDEG